MKRRSDDDDEDGYDYVFVLVWGWRFFDFDLGVLLLHDDDDCLRISFLRRAYTLLFSPSVELGCI